MCEKLSMLTSRVSNLRSVRRHSERPFSVIPASRVLWLVAFAVVWTMTGYGGIAFGQVGSVDDPLDMADSSGDIKRVEAWVDEDKLHLTMTVYGVFAPSVEKTPAGMTNRYYYHWLLDTDNNPNTGYLNNQYEGNPTNLKTPIGVDVLVQFGWRNGATNGVYAYTLDPLTGNEVELFQNYAYTIDGDTIHAVIPLKDLKLERGQTIAVSAFQEGASNGWQVDWVESFKLTLEDTFVSAYNPNPADGAILTQTWATLSWSPDKAAVSHDVYFGDNHDDVANGTGNTFRGNQGDSLYIVGFPGYPYPDGLVPGTTYYWRIDEVNKADPKSPWKGDVWSFTIPPRTAYSPSPADGAEFVDLNTQLGWTPGLGAVFHTVYFGSNYDTVSAATGGTQQPATTYKPGPLQAEKVYYWRVDESDALVTYKGDVWGFTTPGAAGNPQPSNGAADVAMTKTLSWTPATGASSHDVYFGTDENAVRSATTASPEYKGNKARGSESYDPGKLAWHSPYYWRVDAVYPAPANSVKGLVWNFNTADFISVDDFESYNDINPGEPGSNRIIEAWDDGFGTTTNGALVGKDLPPYAERAIIHGGAQSMPYSYDNNLKYSEATKTLTYPRDWTQDGVTALSLWFRGKAANAAEPMYVALNGGAPVYNDNAGATQATDWQEWSIPLKKFTDTGVNLTNVTSISIGLGTRGNTTVAGGSGQIYVDDIRLTRPAGPPAETWTYTFTGDAATSGPANSFDSLDGSWDHNNGSDHWDGSAIGAGAPGGVSALDGFLRLQDPGDPRDYAMPDASNRNIYLGHSITKEIGAAGDAILDTGVTLSCRARVSTQPPLDNLYPDGGAGIAAWPAGGDGYLGHSGGKANFGIRQLTGDKIISFSLALASDSAFLGGKSGLVLNSLNGTSPSGTVDAGENEGTLRILELDPTVWHDYRITIERDATGTGTHLVKVYLDGSTVSSDFIITAGNGNDYDDSYIALGLGSTGQSGAFDVDYFSYKPGIFPQAP